MEPEPLKLYHYTSAEGLLGIISSKSIWATTLNYLNDSKEFEYGLDLAAHFLHSTGLVEGIDLARCLRRGSEVNVCVCSFSREGDQLSQWRGYCPKEGGYSMGFDFKTLKEATSSQGFTLAACIYKHNDQMLLLKPTLEHALTRYLEILSANKERRTATEQTYAWLLTQLMPIVPLLKHPAFEEEREWRLVSAYIPRNDARMRFRAARGIVFPYVAVDLPVEKAGLLKEVIVGPHINPKAAFSSLSWFTVHQATANWGVIPSQIPFRQL